MDEAQVPGRDAFEVEIEAICHACNTGWMHRIEMQISKWIGPSLNNGTGTFPLDQHQREVVGAWAVKTGLMVELALRELRHPSFVPESHFGWLYEHREHPSPPPGCVIWMFGVSLNFGSGKWLRLASSNSLRLVEDGVGVPPAYFVTFHTGLIGFQVFGPDMAALDAEAMSPPFPVPAKIDPLISRVWPAPRKPPLRWPPKPPKRVLGMAELEYLAEWPRMTMRPPQSR